MPQVLGDGVLNDYCASSPGDSAHELAILMNSAYATLSDEESAAAV